MLTYFTNPRPFGINKKCGDPLTSERAQYSDHHDRQIRMTKIPQR